MKLATRINQRFIDRSLEIILQNQDPEGGFVASPTFPTYAYCWFRDGSFIAYALDLYGYHTAARKFYNWAARIILQREHVVNTAIQKAGQKQPLGEDDILHTRYNLDGTENTATPWENFQLDGFGTYLWALDRHLQLSGQPANAELIRAARITAKYLTALWQSPCYDCWEEFRDEIHPHTLAAIYAGLRAAGNITREDHSGACDQIARFLQDNAAPDGYWQKFIGNPQVDASLIGLATPYRVCEPTDPIMVETIKRVEADLGGGGVKRYATDTYYGGGRWILLSAWLSWYYAEIDEVQKAEQQLDWIESQFDENDALPEQIAEDVNDPEMIPFWEKKWGKSANPLLWSHANYLISRKMLGAR